MNIPKIKGLMAEKGISQRTLAQLTGHGTAIVNRWFTGRQQPRADEILEICKLLEINDDETIVSFFLRDNVPCVDREKPRTVPQTEKECRTK